MTGNSIYSGLHMTSGKLCTWGRIPAFSMSCTSNHQNTTDVYLDEDRTNAAGKIGVTRFSGKGCIFNEMSGSLGRQPGKLRGTEAYRFPAHIQRRRNLPANTPISSWNMLRGMATKFSNQRKFLDWHGTPLLRQLPAAITQCQGSF